MKRIESPRDIIILSDGRQCLVTAVDSCGGIGEKTGDALYCPLELVGFHTARVTLLEVLAAGAEPVVAAVSACNAPLDAEKLLEGIKRAFTGFNNMEWCVSTEKNMPTCMTALGVSVTGVCAQETLRVGRSLSGDRLCLAGLPLVGREVLDAGDDILKPEHMSAFLANSLIGSLLPVGSKGIGAEAGVLARESGLAAILDEECGVDFKKSAGPSSCVIFSARPDFSDTFLGGKRIRVIGRLE